MGSERILFRVLDYWVFLDVAKTNVDSLFFVCLFFCVLSIFCITLFGADCTNPQHHETTRSLLTELKHSVNSKKTSDVN